MQKTGPIVTGKPSAVGSRLLPAAALTFILASLTAIPAFSQGASFSDETRQKSGAPPEVSSWRPRLIAESGGASAAELEDLYKKGEAAYAQKNYGEAASYLQTILSSNPNFARAHNLLGRIYHKSGKIELAITEYKKALSNDSHLTEARFNLGVACFDQGEYEQALHYFEAAASREKNGEYEYNLALTLQKLNERDKAIEAYLRAVKIDPKNAVAHYSLGRLLQESGDNDKAIIEYKAALQINPNFADAHNNLGVAYGAKGDYNGSIAEFQAALKVNPELPQAQQNLGYAQAHTSLGITYFKQGDYDRAFDEYKKALKIDPGFADAQYNLGLLYQKKGEVETAVGHYQAAIKLDPKNAKPHNNLGVAYSQLNKVDLAEAEYRQALKLNPNYQEAQQNLTSLLQSQGRKE
ncbi:MAG TPA: tetratricopeptide repeat protein [Planktothrix sp.]|jgi:tetratricopeptide (TPR) repeat protein